MSFKIKINNIASYDETCIEIDNLKKGEKYGIKKYCITSNY
jgi:hypothetical protein